MWTTFAQEVSSHTAVHLNLSRLAEAKVKDLFIAKVVEPMRRQVESWKQTQISDDQAKLTIYCAFSAGELEAPKHLARRVHELYFYPPYEEFASRTVWSLGNAFTSAFEALDPIPQFKATAKLAQFLESVQVSAA
jgi:hypothetical protein